MWHRLTTYGIHARHGFHKGYPFPKAAPLASRRDAWGPQGQPPAGLASAKLLAGGNGSDPAGRAD